jgi:serine/threonine-protein kinase HipA
VIERYDRAGGRRIHQEDFSQALGASGNQKYQEMGGVVSLQRVAETLVRHAPEQDLAALARMVILAVGIGNLALAVNGKYRHADVTTGDDLLVEFTSWGLRRAATTIVDTLDQLEEAVKDEAPLEGSFPALRGQILGFIANLRGGTV